MPFVSPMLLQYFTGDFKWPRRKFEWFKVLQKIVRGPIIERGLQFMERVIGIWYAVKHIKSQSKDENLAATKHVYLN